MSTQLPPMRNPVAPPCRMGATVSRNVCVRVIEMGGARKLAEFWCAEIWVARDPDPPNLWTLALSADADFPFAAGEYVQVVITRLDVGHVFTADGVVMMRGACFQPRILVHTVSA